MSIKIGKYEIRAEFGHDTFTRTFRAFDPDVVRPVTVVVLTEVADNQRLTSFRSDAAAAANIHHENIAAIYELGEHVGLPFIAMQHLQGEDLRQVIASRTPLTLLQKMLLMFDVADALKAAHRGGISHVGITPAGIILLEDGSAKITELGAVRLTRPAWNGSAQQESYDGEALYMSPEQLTSSASPDLLSDIFAYGAIYYELLTGEHPFAPAGSRAVTLRIVNEDPTPLRTLAPDCPEALEQIVHRALQKDRELRYQSLDDVQCDAEPVLQELKRERAAALLIEGHRLLGEEQSDRAQAVVREVLELDPGNREARRLRDTIREPLQRRIIRSRLDALVRRADDEAAARRFGEAVQILESALRLDPADAAIRSRLEEARAFMERSHRGAAFLAEARQFLDEQNLAEARQSASAAIENDPESHDARQLLETIQEAIERREQDLRFEEELTKAKNLVLVESFEEAIAILAGLEAGRPGSQQVAHWLSHARDQKSAKERQDRLQAGLTEARRHLENAQFREAVEQLEALRVELPEEERVMVLWAEAQDRLRIHERAQAVEKVRTEALGLCQARDFAVAIRVLEQGLESFPEEAELQRVLDDTLAASASYEREQAIAAAVRGALQEAQWLMDQGRPDLAAQLLRRNSTAYPEEVELTGRLALAEEILSDWEKRRSVQETLARVAALEHRQQWRTALIVLEEALKAHPGAAELAEATERLQSQIRESERQRKLARRLDLIRQKMAEQDWTQALSFIEASEKDFPGEPELERLLAQARLEQQRVECENVITAIGQCLADGELEQAEEILRRALECHPRETRLQALQEELEREKVHQGQWRAAEVLFGRRQFQEAEKILLALAARTPNHPDVRALLEAVRSGRADTEEQQFCDRGRLKALRLIEEQQFDEAVDLLRNLLSLFPNDPILQRDLQSALAARGQNRDEDDSAALEEETAPVSIAEESGDLQQSPSGAVVAGVAEKAHPPAAMPGPVQFVGAPFQIPVSSWRRPALLTMVALFLVTAATVPLWRFSRKQQSIALASPAPAPAKPAIGETRGTRTPAPPPAGSEPASSPSAAGKASADKTEKKVAATPARRVLEAFTLWRSGTPPRPGAPVPAPPAGIQETAASVPPGLPGASMQPIESPPASAAPVVILDGGPAPAKPERLRVGGDFQEPQLLSGPNVVIPQMARERKIYGVVKLEATISKEGTVTNVAAVSGHPILVEVARQAILARRYRPAILNGEPVEIKVPIQVVFDPKR